MQAACSLNNRIGPDFPKTEKEENAGVTGPLARPQWGTLLAPSRTWGVAEVLEGLCLQGFPTHTPTGPSGKGGRTLSPKALSGATLPDLHPGSAPRATAGVAGALHSARTWASGRSVIHSRHKRWGQIWFESLGR